MVRAQAKQTPDERKDGKKKASSASAGGSKKKPDTGSWPCKMDGCKKVFAREADLKRHQRTTKTHSIPGFQCPQCDATFTRTDALRRHQKSRHNGVVIEPSEDKSKHSGDDGSSGSRSPSPGGSPSRSQGEGSTNSSPAHSTSHAESSGRGGNYYRPHTMQDGYYPAYPTPPRPGMLMDPHYPQPIGIPTSATRGNWGPPPAAPPPWPGAEALPPPPPPPPGMYLHSYYASPYYRHPGVPGPPPPHLPQINPELLAQSNGQPNGVGPPESALRNTSAEDPPPAHAGRRARSPAATSASAGTKAGSAEPPPPAGDGPDEATLVAAAALQAVLAFQKEQEVAAALAGVAPVLASPSSPPGQGRERERGQEGAKVAVEQAPDAGPAAVPVRGEAEERDGGGAMSVDDLVHAEATASPSEGGGVRILNPAELLTQVEHLLNAAEPPGR